MGRRRNPCTVKTVAFSPLAPEAGVDQGEGTRHRVQVATLAHFLSTQLGGKRVFPDLCSYLRSISLVTKTGSFSFAGVHGA